MSRRHSTRPSDPEEGTLPLPQEGGSLVERTPAGRDRPARKRGRDGQLPLRVGLALGSGVARGWAHLGVLRTLQRRGIEADIVSGTSMGAVIGGAYLAGQLDALEEWARGLTKVRMVSYLDFKVRAGGMIGGRHLARLLTTALGGIAIEDLRRPFVAVAADMLTGHEVWLRRGKLVDALRASSALPGVFPPVPHQGRWLVDGALVNPVPVSPCQALGAQVTIAVNLNTDISGRVRAAGIEIPTAGGYDLLNDVSEGEDEKVRASLRDALTRRLFRREPQRPSMLSVMFNALNIVTDRIARSRLAGDPPDVQIAPKLGHIGWFEFDRAEEMIAAGEAAAEQALAEIEETLAAYGMEPKPERRHP